MDGTRTLDSNERGEKLVEVKNDMIDTVFFIAADGVEYCLDDWQSLDKPATLADVPNYNWNRLDEIETWHS